MDRNEKALLREAVEDIRPALALLESLVDSNQQIKTVIDALPFPAWVKDSDCCLIWANQQYLDHYGASRQSCLGRIASDSHEKYFENIAATDRLALEKKELIVFSDNTTAEPRTIVKFAVFYRGDALIFGASLPHETFNHTHDHLSLCG